MDYVLWLKDLLERFWKWLAVIASGMYATFHYLFEPSEAWNAVWKMFLGSFITKMIELAYDEESGKWGWSIFKTRFSASVGLYKGAPKMLLYLLLMFAVASAKDIFTQTVVDNFHFTAAAILFTLELFNSMQHLGKLPTLSKLARALKEMIKQLLVPKGFQKLFDDEKDDEDV